MEKILRQAGICIIILLSVFVLQDLNIASVNKGLAVCYRQINQDHSIDELAAFGVKTVETIKDASAVMASVALPSGREQYGEPIDGAQTGTVSVIYAVSGGTVIAAGEDEKLGKFVKIAHGKESESVYGQCSKIYVRPLERVKRGQVIAEYTNESEQEFYYVLSYLK